MKLEGRKIYKGIAEGEVPLLPGVKTLYFYALNNDTRERSEIQRIVLPESIIPIRSDSAFVDLLQKRKS